MSQTAEEAFHSTRIEHIKQQPHTHGVLAVTFRTRDGWRSTVKLPTFVGNRPVEVGDPIALVYDGRQIIAVELRGVRVPMPFRAK